ncbi:MAG: putative glyoxalase superfamily protein PhnB [Verrucomicrobiales bacterium]
MKIAGATALPTYSLKLIGNDERKDGGTASTKRTQGSVQAAGEFVSSSYSGGGSLFSLEVDDAAAAYEDAIKLGLEIALELRSEEWAPQHFMLRDPHGLTVDIVQSTEPAEEYVKDYSKNE